MFIKGAFLTLIVFFSLVACNSADHQTTTTSTIQPITVELDIYSGRPNPTWTLTTQEQAELTQRLQKLPTLPAVPPVDHLGYRGFLLHNPGQVAGIGTQVRVYKGIIIITNQGSTGAYKDSHALEQWLREQAHTHGQDDALKAAGQ